MNDFGSNSKDDNFVDIHGREIYTTTKGPNGETLCLLSDLKQTGVGIYQRSQHAKLSTIDMECNQEFVNYMLEKAKSYMLSNKISFSDEQIMNSIQQCKQALGNKSSVARTEKHVWKDRKVEASSDNDIQIKVPNTSNPKTSPTPPKEPFKPLRQFPKKGVFNKTLQMNGTDKPECKNDGNSKATGAKPRPPKQQNKFTPPKVLEELDVIVTAIDKPNCIWVRNLASNDEFEEIHRRVNEEASHQKAAPKPWEMQRVLMAQDEDQWFRCKVIKHRPLTVFFMDYGNCVEVSEVREVSEELAQKPCMAIRITFKEAHYVPCLEDIIRIRSFHKNEDGTLFVNILKDRINPCIVKQDIKNSTVKEHNNEKVKNSKPLIREQNHEKTCNTQKDPEYFKKPPVLGELKDDQIVAIFSLKDDVFYMRTKECFDKLKEIEKLSEDCGKSAKHLQKCKLNQIVLYENKAEGKFYRALVTRTDGKNVELELLDHVESVTAELSSLKSINEQLSKEPLAYISGSKLQNFEDKMLDEDCTNLIRDYIKTRKKFSVALGFDNELDLFDGKKFLSEELQKLEKLPKRVLLKHMKTYKPETGVKSYVCGFYRNSKEFALAESDALTEHIDHVLKTEHDDKVPYIPIEGEVCFCFYLANWYRCVVTRIFDKECQVLFLDFGNMEIIKKEDLRKADNSITDVPVLALPCVLSDLPRRQNVEDILKNKIREGDVYNVNFKELSEGKWQVEIPTVYKEIREAL